MLTNKIIWKIWLFWKEKKKSSKRCKTRWLRNKVFWQVKEKNIATIHHFNFLEKKKLSSRLIINQAAVLRFDLWERERIANWSLQCPHRRPLLKPMGPWIHVFSHRPLIIMLLDKGTQIVKPNLTRKIVKYHQNHTIRW